MKVPEFILTGYEHGGTTLLSELFRSNGFASGFEVGVLLNKDPSLFPTTKDLWELLMPGWNITHEIAQRAISGDFTHFYNTIISSAFPEHQGPFFDKTPRYMSCLGLCLHRAPFIEGAAVIHRDPRAVFVSQARHLEPTLEVREAVEKRFKFLTELYIHYFIGSIGHIDNPRVIFCPFEELVSRENAWLKILGNFSIGKAFSGRSGMPTFDNVTSSKMDSSKILEFDRLLPSELQSRILEATRIAAPFFAGPIERARYGDLWEETFETAQKRLAQFELPAVGMDIDGTYFEPLTYLIRYPDVLQAGVNPVEHFRKAGHRENRIPA